MVKGLKDENAPKRPLSAYFAWCATVRAKVTKSLPEGSGVAQAGKKMSEMWNKLTDSQKAPFEKKYRSEKEKYDKKLAKYKLTKDYANFQKKKEQHKVDAVKNKKFKKDENAPKRPLSAFFLFMGDEREALIEGGLSFKEAGAKLGVMWSKLSAAKKKPYEDKAAAAKAKYAKELEKYQKSAKYKKYQAEKEEFMANKKADLKKLDEKQNPKPKKPKKKEKKASKSRSRSAPRRAGKKSKVKKAAKRSRSRSKSKGKGKKKGKKKSRN